MTSRARQVALRIAFAACLALMPALAFAVEKNLAGSAQLDYHAIAKNLQGPRTTGEPDAFDAFTLEAALKLAVDVSEHLSANVKLCYGCHGFEADMFYFDLRASDELNLRVGRMSPSFGSFTLRHDPANHKLSDKPLPYDMGRMIRFGAWNNGVLPSPFPDNGVELNGTHWFGEDVALDYAVYAVSGFKQSGRNPTDFNFQESHMQYYTDNNSRPSVGTRLALTMKLGERSDATLGGSLMGGTYDPEARLGYVIAGGDATLRVERTTLRLEYLLRRQKFDTSNPAIFKYAIPATGDGSFFVKHGAFAELEHPLTHDLDVIARLDGMYRAGNVLATSDLSSSAWVARATLGTAFAVERNLRLKASVELWQFRDRVDDERRREWTIHLGAVGSF
jgi:hypothetical protein